MAIQTPNVSDTELANAHDVIVVQGAPNMYPVAVQGPGGGAVVVSSASGVAAGASIVSSTAQENSHVIKSSPGTLFSLVGVNNKASLQYIQIFNATSAPADGSAPVYTFPVPAATPFSLDVPIVGMPFTTGIYVCNSSTLATKTIGSADCWFTAVLK